MAYQYCLSEQKGGIKVKKKLLIGGIIIGLISVILISIQLDKKRESSAAVISDDGKILIPVRNPDSPLGTKDNPFVLLEIVPYEGFAEIGYLIGGQEPVNLERVRYSTFGGTIGSTNAITSVGSNVGTFFPSVDMLEVAKPTHYTKDQYGYYEKVKDGKRNYKQVDISYGIDGKVISAKYQVVEEGTGEYDWVGFENGISHTEITNHSADKVYTIKQSELYQAHVYTYTNKNIFLKQCLGLNEDQIADYQIKVITVTATQINNNLSLIDRADLIYITDKSHNGDGFIHMWNSPDYRRKDLFSYSEVLPNDTNYREIRFQSKGRDFSWEAVERILKKKIGLDLPQGEHACPIIYDTSSLTSNIETEAVTIEKKMKDGTKTYKVAGVQGSSNNAYKLGLMLRQMDTYDLYKMYFEKNSSDKKIITTAIRDDGMTTGKFNDLVIPSDAQKDKQGNDYPSIYWAADTLYPYHLVNYDDNVEHLKKDLAELGYRWNDFGGTNTQVEDNTYIFNADNSLGMSFTSASVGYGPHTAEAFDYFYPTLTTEQKQSKTLTPAQVVKFLLIRSTFGRDFDRDISILEIEPCADFKTQLQWENYIYGLLPGFTHKVIIERQTTKEFIGKIEDLNGTYDIIYIGLRNGTLGNSLFHDINMRNLIYMHVGDLVMMKQEVEGHNLVNWDTSVDKNPFPIHLSGNDITKRRKEDLLTFARAGYPIILQDDIYTEAGDVNRVKVDSASNLYQLFDTLKREVATTASTFIEKKTSGFAFENKLRMNFSSLDLIKQPIDYQDKETRVAKGLTTADADIYVNGADSTNKILNYEFTIQDTSMREQYGLKFYLDLNSNGYFDLTELQKIEHVIRVEDGALVKVTELKQNTNYRLIIDVTKLQGVLPWKLRIERLKSDLSYSNIRRDVTGISAIKNTYEDKVGLKILQLYSKDRVSIALPTKEDIDASGAKNLTGKNNIINSFIGHVTVDGKTLSNENGNANLARATGKLYYYTKDLEDYQLTFERLSVEDFVEMCRAGSADLRSYDMLIVGFADMSTDLSDAAIQKVKEFSNSGKTILFTHDTTYVTTTHQTTIAFREKLGMDRFGMMLKRAGKSIGEIALEKDLPYIPNKEQRNDNSNVYFQQLYGYTDQTALRFAESNPIELKALTTKNITKVNDGQITSYPYRIDESMLVAPTHHQYFQLDMEDPDLVVWYCLKTDNDSDKDVYVKNDVRNGYYIYSKGNITYSGTGHMVNAASFGEIPDMEVKLFVNTIVAAYRSTPAVTQIEINNEDKTSLDGIIDYLYVDYDTSNTEYAVGNGIEMNGDSQTKRLLFTLKDKSKFSNKETKLTYTLIQYSNTGEIINSQVKTLVTREVSSNKEVAQDKVLVDTPYYINVPLNILKSGQYGYMGIKIDLTVRHGESLEYSLKNTKDVFFLRRGLFDLD